MSRLSLVAFFICFCISFSFAQDTAKNSDHAPPVEQHTPKYHKYRYHAIKTDSPKLNTVAAQTGAQKPDTSKNAQPVIKSLHSQYLDLLTQFYHYQQPALIAFWKSTNDTLKQFKSKQKEASLKLLNQSKTIDSLKAQLLIKDQKLANKVDEINFIGVTMPLFAYSLLVWALIIILGFVTFGVIARSTGFKNEAHYRIKLYGELEDEFKAYKTKANDKEKKLARELQTERNKLDELLGRG